MRTGRRRQHDGGRGHAAAGPLHEHPFTGLELGPGEQHPVGGDPRRPDPRGLLQAEVRRLGQEVLGREGDPGREGPVDPVGQHPEFAAAVGQHRVEDDLLPVG
jgi:hypothetical protein